MTALADLGQRVAGQVLNGVAWEQEDRIQAATPARHVIGTVYAIYPCAPHVVGVVLASGVQVTVYVGGVPECADCGHGVHELGDCAAAVWADTPAGTRGVAQECPCGVDAWLARRELADRAWETTQDEARVAASEADR